MTSRPLGLERLSGKVGPEVGQADKLEEAADDLGFAGLHEVLVGDGVHAGVASRLCGNHDTDGWTALHAAAAFGSARHASCAVALLAAGADVHAQFYDDEEDRHYTPLLQLSLIHI